MVVSIWGKTNKDCVNDMTQKEGPLD